MTQRKYDREQPQHLSSSPQQESSQEHFRDAERDSEPTQEQVGKRDMRIVGIGASAGGLEALEQFFRSMSETEELAFVVVQHLSPDYKSVMVELLSKYTEMKVERVSDGMEIEPRHVYLIPPRKLLTVKDGRLYLAEQDPEQGLHLPIDIFFRSLSEEQAERAIAVIVSGTGSDGTLGIRAIKGAGGLVFVQDNLTAKFDGMPRSASATGLVDYILSPEKIAEELSRIVRTPIPQYRESGDEVQGKEAAEGIGSIISLLRERGGIDFSRYKEGTLARRIERRIGMNQLDSMGAYAEYLRTSPTELHILQKDLLIGVTRFFRDPEAFEEVKKNVVPRLLGGMKEKRPLRVWSLGCSTGEEAYSIAILFHEALREMQTPVEVKIFATDIDPENIQFASAGVYPESIVTDINKERLHRYFTKKDNVYHVHPDIRRMVVFANHDVIQEPPFSSIDMVSCRNMLIYLKSDLQQQVLNTLQHALTIGGYLFLGPSEVVGDMHPAYELLHPKWKIYRCTQKPQGSLGRDYNFIPPVQRQGTETSADPVGRGTRAVSKRAAKESESLLATVYEALLEEYVPPAVVIDRNLDLIHVCREADHFLKFPAGRRASLNLIDMLPEGLRAMVSTAVHRTIREHTAVSYRDIPYRRGSATESVTLTVKPVEEIARDATGHFLLVFDSTVLGREQPAPERNEGQLQADQGTMIADLERELQYTKENLQATIEELETSNEELQATNEELLASNEELQSTNEELQAVNEELYTVNAEYQKKIEELRQANNDMKNFLDNTDIGMIFLDNELCIRKYTQSAVDAVNITKMDIGYPIRHLSRSFKDSRFIEDLEKVRENQRPVTKEVQTTGGNWKLLKILPYLTMQEHAEGIVVTFLDITENKRSEKRLRQERDLLMRVLEHSPEGKTMVNEAGRLVFANQRAAELFGISREELLNYTFDDRGWKMTDREGRELPAEQLPFNQIRESGRAVYNFAHAVEKPNGERIVLRINGSPSYNDKGVLSGAVFSMEELEAGEWE